MSRDIDPALVEKAAHALHDAMCCDGIYPCKEPVEQPYTTLARAVLAAVAADIRLDGAADAALILAAREATGRRAPDASPPSRIVSETWVDADGIHRHSNCRGFGCKVVNCRDSRICDRDPSKPNSVAEDFPVQIVRERAPADGLIAEFAADAADVRRAVAEEVIERVCAACLSLVAVLKGEDGVPLHAIPLAEFNEAVDRIAREVGERDG